MRLSTPDTAGGHTCLSTLRSAQPPCGTGKTSSVHHTNLMQVEHRKGTTPKSEEILQALLKNSTTFFLVEEGGGGGRGVPSLIHFSDEFGSPRWPIAKEVRGKRGG